MARSYEKFFRINEVRETEMIALKNRLKFPVKAYVKENGFLGIVSYNYKTDDLFVATKSSDKGDCAEYFKVLLEPYRAKILQVYRLGRLNAAARQNKTYTEEDIDYTPVSLVFEVIDTENDPHIIHYNESKVVLLDLICNKLNFKALDYERVKEAAKIIGCPVKELAYTIKDYDEFRDLVNRADDEDFKYNGNYIEGFVFVDQNGFMTKLKTGYYNFWKHMRSVADSTLRCGSYRRMGSLLTVQGNQFAAFCKECFNKDRIKETKSYPYKTDIISLREKYYKEFKK
jgi:tRNA splicing ligase